MARKYKFMFASGVPEEIKANFPEHLEAGPGTIEQKIREMHGRLDPAYEIIEDEHDYILHVRKAAKPRKAA